MMAMRARLAMATCIMALFAAPAAASAPPQPKLVIAISVDQFSADLFAQHRADFTGGMKRLESGVVFGSGYQTHAATETCPGHSTILSGMRPAHTGMVGNTIWDVASQKAIYCLDDGKTPVANMSVTRSPDVLRASTLGAWMKDANPQSRVFAVAGKDRAAITMGGGKADGEFWWNDEKGGFTTFLPAGTTAEARLAVIAGFNAALAKTWDKKPPAWKMRNASCAAQFGPETYGGITVDHRIPAAGWDSLPKGATAIGADQKAQFVFKSSPEFDRVILEAATNVIDTQKLGRGPATDLITIGLSATDYVGHRFGSQGPEMCDQMSWLDARLGAFFAHIDSLKIPYIVVLTADHGSVDAAERAAERGIPAVRIDSGATFKKVNALVRAAFNLDFDPLLGSAGEIAISNKVDPALRHQVITATVAMLKLQPGVADAFTKDELLATQIPNGKPADAWTMRERFAANTLPDRSADIQVLAAEFATPNAVSPNATYIAGHGSAWNYDRRVPMLFWWPGIKGFEQPLAVETVDIAPTLAAVLGIQHPPVDGRCLDLDGGKGDTCAVK
jgi:predicted AlkP superfamily pyrophosphatase or phosphodiesterase